MSRFIALLILISFSPIWVVVSLLTLVFQGLPLIFVQNRVGKGKSEFSIYKLRTMSDGKITKWGKFLRNTGLDEFPQLWNIIIGDMGFIGPRPLTQFDIDRLGWSTVYHATRWVEKPGITGLAQLTPACHQKVSWFYDCYYSRHKSVCLDISIGIQTLLVALIGKKRLKVLKKI